MKMTHSYAEQIGDWLAPNSQFNINSDDMGIKTKTYKFALWILLSHHRLYYYFL